LESLRTIVRPRYRRANLDGSDVETLVTGLDYPREVDVDFQRLFVDGFESGDLTRCVR